MRRKNWTESETIAFVNVWTDYYPIIISGTSKHSAIYHSMAKQFCQTLKDRFIITAAVKSKLDNLVTEYRRKKNELGITDGSPSL